MGSIEHRGKNSYRLSVVVGYDEKGYPIRERKTIKVKNKTEAQEQLVLFKAEVLTGIYKKPQQLTLRQFYDDWYKYAVNEYEPDTLRDYVNIINARVLPKYGNMKLSYIEPIHVVKFLDDLRKDGRRLDGKEGKLSDSTIRNVYKAFNSIMACAEKWKLIKENPVASVEIPKVTPNKIRLNYSLEKIFQLINCIKKEPLEKQVIFWIAFVTSARQGEIAALEERHILTDKHAIRFEQSFTEVKGKGLQLKSIKNHLEGTAAIPEELTEMIGKLLKKKRKEKLLCRDKYLYPDTIFLFCNEFGKPMRPDSISQWWSRFIKRNKLEKIRFHDLRHLSITFLIGQNVPIKSISERARHSKIGTTMDIYGHAIEEIDRIAADKFKQFFQWKHG